MERTFVGDIVILQLSTGIDLIGNTLLRLECYKPDGTCVYFTAGVNPDDTRIAQYMTTETDLDVHGTWRAQVYVEFVDWQGHGLWVEFKVYKPLC